jgi:hypothetical protein
VPEQNAQDEHEIEARLSSGKNKIRAEINKRKKRKNLRLFSII